jgi:hypothetical protein
MPPHNRFSPAVERGLMLPTAFYAMLSAAFVGVSTNLLTSILGGELSQTKAQSIAIVAVLFGLAAASHGALSLRIDQRRSPDRGVFLNNLNRDRTTLTTLVYCVLLSTLLAFATLVALLVRMPDQNTAPFEQDMAPTCTSSET